MDPWRNIDEVEYATLERVDWFNNRRLFGPLGRMPPPSSSWCIIILKKPQPRRLDSRNQVSGNPGAVQTALDFLTGRLAAKNSSVTLDFVRSVGCSTARCFADALNLLVTIPVRFYGRPSRAPFCRHLPSCFVGDFAHDARMW